MADATEKHRKTITSIKPGPDNKKWRGYTWDDKEFASVDVVFADGDEGAYNSTPTAVEEHVTAIEKLVDQEQEFDLKGKPAYRDIPQWKIVDYPGNPKKKDGAWNGGGGGSVKKGDWETAEERAVKQQYIIAQSSLGQAVKLAVDGGEGHASPDDALAWALDKAAVIHARVIEMAMIHDRLIKTAQAEAEVAPATTTPAATTQPQPIAVATGQPINVDALSEEELRQKLKEMGMTQ